MSVRTLVGVVADKDGLAQRKELAPRKTNGWAPELRCRSWSLPSREYRDRQERVPVTLGHGGARVGKLQHLELDRQDRLVAVATVDADIVEFGDWFFSAGAKYRGDADSQFSGADIGREIELFELVLTRNPASISLRPLDVLDGDLTRSYVRQRWRVERSRRELFERAASSAGRGGPLTIRRGDPEIVKVEGGYLVDDELVAVSSGYDARPPGAMRYGTWHGRMLSVR
jgi:hypothetical protein